MVLELTKDSGSKEMGRITFLSKNDGGISMGSIGLRLSCGLRLRDEELWDNAIDYGAKACGLLKTKK